jgi:hypothetical protein
MTVRPTLVDMTVVLFGVAGVIALGLVTWAGHRMLADPAPGGSGAAGAFGGFSEVFDPGRARAEHDLDSREHQGEIVPSPDDDDRLVRVDLTSGRAHVRRPKP